MKAFSALALLLLVLGFIANVEANKFKLVRHSLYQFKDRSDGDALYKFRVDFLKKNAPGAKAVKIGWAGSSVGYNSESDFNYLILGYYPSKSVFDSYQAKEKASQKYLALRAKADLNANFVEKL